jgi:putative flippase GtrA
MSSSSPKAALLTRFAASGVVNGIIGFSLIFLLMALGVSATAANVCGYAAGLVSSFVLNRRFVFVASGELNREMLRFLAAFAVSFGANLAVLRLSIASSLNPYLAQLVATATYVVVMFVLCDAFVFPARERRRR